MRCLHFTLAVMLLFAVPMLVTAKPPSGGGGNKSGGGGGGGGGGGSSSKGSSSSGSRGSSFQGGGSSNKGPSSSGSRSAPSFQGGGSSNKSFQGGSSNKGSSGPTLQEYRERTFKNDGGGSQSQVQNQFKGNPSGNTGGNWNKDGGGNWNKDGNNNWNKGSSNWNKDGNNNWNKDNNWNKTGSNNWNKGNWNNNWNHDHDWDHNHNHWHGNHYPWWGWSVGFYLPLGYRYPYWDYGDTYYRDGYYYEGGTYSVPQYPEQAAESTPPLPGPQDLAMMDQSQLREMILAGARSFQADMANTANGSGWIEFLAVPELIGTLEAAGGENAAPDAAKNTERLAQIAGRFESTSNNSAYASLADRWGFQIVLRGLPEYLRPQAERSQQQFSSAVAMFDETLAGIETGPGWRDYLKVDDLERMRESKEFPTAEQVTELKPILAQFDKVARDPRYRTVVGLDGFIPLHVSLMRATGEMKSHLEAVKPPEKAGEQPAEKPAEKKPAAPMDPIPL